MKPLKTMFIKRGTAFSPTDDSNLDIHEKLPVGTYLIKRAPFDGPLYFDRVPDFKLPMKLYGDTAKHSERILSTFKMRESSTGVLLAGEKGSGKTLLSKHLSVASGLPVILVNDPWSGDLFNTLVSSLQQEAVFVFDEFEKVYSDQGDQEGLLTLLDGFFATKKLFILTCNDIYKVNEHLKNRPGRLFYFIKYKGLSPEFVKEYCEDKLLNKSNIDSVCNLSMLFEEFNFDMLAAVVEEMNRYGEDAHEAVKILNVQPDSYSQYGEFIIKIQNEAGVQFQVVSPAGGIMNKNPAFSGTWEVMVFPDKYKGKELPTYETGENEQLVDWYDLSEADKKKIIRIKFSKKDIVSVDNTSGTYVFKEHNKGGFIATVTKKPVASYGMAF